VYKSSDLEKEGTRDIAKLFECLKMINYRIARYDDVQEIYTGGNSIQIALTAVSCSTCLVCAKVVILDLSCRRRFSHHKVLR
jgi:hypothetical protein